MRIYIKRHNHNAGKYIYRGYEEAWKFLGYDVKVYNNLNEIDDFGVFQIMAVDSDFTPHTLKILDKAEKTYVYTQPNVFPMPWGKHPNFVSHCSDYIIEELNSRDNVHLWNWSKEFPFHTKWKNVNSLPLAFDSLSYKLIQDERVKYDCCFIGTWADNGFNEKRDIILKYLGAFMKSGLRCGFYLNKNISHEEENLVLSNSKVSLNIHDAYQQKLGLDTNERTFKSLGLTGTLVSDDIGQIKELFPQLPVASDPQEMVSYVKDYLSRPESELRDIKEYYRKHIKENHSYVSRVKDMIEYGK